MAEGCRFRVFQQDKHLEKPWHFYLTTQICKSWDKIVKIVVTSSLLGSNLGFPMVVLPRHLLPSMPDYATAVQCIDIQITPYLLITWIDDQYRYMSNTSKLTVPNHVSFTILFNFSYITESDLLFPFSTNQNEMKDEIQISPLYQFCYSDHGDLDFQ